MLFPQMLGAIFGLSKGISGDDFRSGAFLPKTMMNLRDMALSRAGGSTTTPTPQQPAEPMTPFEESMARFRDAFSALPFDGASSAGPRQRGRSGETVVTPSGQGQSKGPPLFTLY